MDKNEERSKYNVSKDGRQREFNGIVFDSKMEMDYYKEVILPGVESGEIKGYEMQKTYILQPGFVRNGKKVLPITYVADFYIEYSDGTEAVVEVKGMPDQKAPIKRKLFWYNYPDIKHYWVVRILKYGGWIEHEEAQRLRRAEKRARIKGGK